jgi:hypothetical protein
MDYRTPTRLDKIHGMPPGARLTLEGKMLHPKIRKRGGVMSYWSTILVVFALAAVLAPQASASSGPGAPYPTALAVHRGQQIVVKLQAGLGKPVKGTFLASEAGGVRVERKSGEQVTVPWESVRKITPKRQWYQFWVGVATGVALAGVAVLTSEGDVGAGWTAGVIGAGAGAGAAAAALGDPVEGPIYEASRSESAAVAHEAGP